MSVYDEMQPRTARGTPAEPKESERAAGGVSVSSLRSAKGGEGARSYIEAIFYVLDNRVLDFAAVVAFVMNEKGAHKLFPLRAHLARAKADAAREAAMETAGCGGNVESLPEREGDDEPDERSAACPLIAAAAFVCELAGEGLAANAEAIARLLEVCRDASARLAAADRLQLKAA